MFEKEVGKSIMKNIKLMIEALKHFKFSKIPYYLSRRDYYKRRSYDGRLKNLLNKMNFDWMIMPGTNEHYIIRVNDRSLNAMYLNGETYSKNDMDFFFEAIKKYYPQNEGQTVRKPALT